MGTLKQIMLAVKDQPKSSDASSSSSSKPATDISHLVKRKRKLEEIVEESEKETEGSPAKKPPA
ncbi:hypothetical protein NQ317_017603 [Molorchus minor]|uniref:Shootin-1 n=1 Tax=Molorchus minor TaxID=1323400 RepID=A0ABQ9J0K1_9CUCU|nr:hypothetical protein NQ317_017603 [Molorchus minor]